MIKLLNYIKQQDYFNSILSFWDFEYTNKRIYPKQKDIFKAFEMFEDNDLKVIIIGQDPYANLGQAMGLAFSVPEGVTIPPSLRNIFKEMSLEFDCLPSTRGDLTYLAKQGVLLLNTILTVEEGKPLSHDIPEYNELIRDVFIYFNNLDQPIVFMLWGGKAGKYARFLNNKNHLVLTANHPSPLSANRGGWFGCNHFIKANSFLLQHGILPINWINH